LSKTDSQANSAFRLSGTALVVLLGLFLIVFAKAPSVIRVIPYGWPEWSLILSIYLAFRAEIWLASLGAFFLGSFNEALSLTPSGMEPLTLIILVISLSFFSKYLKFHHFLYLSLLFLLLFVFKNLFFIPGFLGIMDAFPGHGLENLSFNLASRAVSTALIGPLLHLFLDYILLRDNR
jgi:hypothetical protein